MRTFAVVRDPFDDSPFQPVGLREVPARFTSQDPSGFSEWACKHITTLLRKRYRQVALHDGPDLVFANPCGPYPVPGLVPPRCEMLILWSAEWNASPEWNWCVIAHDISDRRVCMGPMLPPLYAAHDAVRRGAAEDPRLICDAQMPLVPVWYAVDPTEFRPLGLRRTHVWAPGVIDAAVDTYRRRFEFRCAIHRAGYAPPAHVTPARGTGDCDVQHDNRVAFNRVLNTCRLVCCDGSSMRAPIAKFAEVAASGAPMFAAVPGGLSALGFVDGVHYAADHGGDIGVTAARITELVEDPCTQRVGDAAVSLMLERHTRTIRGRQIDAILASVLDGVSKVTWQAGSCYVNGDEV